MDREAKKTYMREYMKTYRKEKAVEALTELDQLKERVAALEGTGKPITMDIVSKIVSQMNETLRKFEVRLQKLESLAKE